MNQEITIIIKFMEKPYNMRLLLSSLYLDYLGKSNFTEWSEEKDNGSEKLYRLCSIVSENFVANRNEYEASRYKIVVSFRYAILSTVNYCGLHTIGIAQKYVTRTVFK